MTHGVKPLHSSNTSVQKIFSLLNRRNGSVAGLCLKIYYKNVQIKYK